MFGTQTFTNLFKKYSCFQLKSNPLVFQYSKLFNEGTSFFRQNRPRSKKKFEPSRPRRRILHGVVHLTSRSMSLFYASVHDIILAILYFNVTSEQAARHCFAHRILLLLCRLLCQQFCCFIYRNLRKILVFLYANFPRKG